MPAGITVAQLGFDPHGTFTVGGTATPGWSAACETVPDALTFK